MGDGEGEGVADGERGGGTFLLSLPSFDLCADFETGDLLWRWEGV